MLARALVDESDGRISARAACFSLRGVSISDDIAMVSRPPHGLKPADQGDVIDAPPYRDRSLVVVSCTDHDSRMFVTELLAALSNFEVFPALHLKFRPGSTDFRTQLRSISQAQPAAVALIAGPQDAARFLTAMRREGLTLPVFGGPAMGRKLFAEAAGPFAEGLLFPLLWHPSAAGERSAIFTRRFRERFGIEPDYTAAHTYDAMNLLITAIRRTGLNRVLIRDAIRDLSPWSGVTGTITWDPTGHNHRSVRLGTIRDGQVTPVGQYFRE